MGIDSRGISEVVSLLQERGLTDDPAEILDGPFAVKPNLQPYQTRFSDGSVRVFYSALDSVTAELEQAYWYKRLILQGQRMPIRMYYRCVESSFDGNVKDLTRMALTLAFVDDHVYGRARARVHEVWLITDRFWVVA